MLPVLFAISMLIFLAGLIVYRLHGDHGNSGPSEDERRKNDENEHKIYLIKMLLMFVLIAVVIISGIALALHPNIWEPLGW